MHASTEVVRAAELQSYIFMAERVKTFLVLCPHLALSVLLLLRKTCTYPHINLPMPSIPLPVFGNSSISHTQVTCQLGPGAFTPKNDRVGRLLCGRCVLRIFVLTGGVYSGFCPFSLKMAPFHTIGALTHTITVYSSGSRHGENDLWRLGPSWHILTGLLLICRPAFCYPNCEV